MIVGLKNLRIVDSTWMAVDDIENINNMDRTKTINTFTYRKSEKEPWCYIE